MKPKLLKLKKGARMKMTGDIPTFDEWMARLDRLLSHYRGMSIYDLPDCPFARWYDERLMPARAVNRALKYASNW